MAMLGIMMPIECCVILPILVNEFDMSQYKEIKALRFSLFS